MFLILLIAKKKHQNVLSSSWNCVSLVKRYYTFGTIFKMNIYAEAELVFNMLKSSLYVYDYQSYIEQ